MAQLMQLVRQRVGRMRLTKGVMAMWRCIAAVVCFDERDWSGECFVLVSSF